MGDVLVQNPLISDHSAIHFTLDISPPPPLRKEFVCRKLKGINLQMWRSDVAEAFSNISEDTGLEELTSLYNTKLHDMLDQHAPEQKKTLTVKAYSPWYTEEIRNEIRIRGSLERQWKISKLTVHKEMYRHQRNHVTNRIAHAKCEYYSQNFVESTKNPRDLYKTVNTLLNKATVSTFPTVFPEELLPGKFAEFFKEKISKIRAEFRPPTCVQLATDEVSLISDINQLRTFHPASESEIQHIIQQAPSKSCSLDPVPTWLVKDSLPELLPVITAVVNKSLSSVTVPSSFKDAIVKPLLKKPSLELNELKNYRPVSNLPFVSKIVERVVVKRLNQHMSDNNLHETYQSAYKKQHSMETPLVRVQNDILRALDKRQSVILVLLDLSSAFDTVDYVVLLTRLSTYLGISGDALSWFSSYLSGRHQTVLVNQHASRKQLLLSGVPQGSVLGPTLFSIYTLPLGDIMRRHGVSFHLFADDTQIYATFNLPDLELTCTRLERCISDIRNWMATNFLKLNSDKTELLLLSSRFSKVDNTLFSLNIAETAIQLKSSARNIGVTFDSNLTLEDHINQICRSSYFLLHHPLSMPLSTRNWICTMHY